MKIFLRVLQGGMIGAFLVWEIIPAGLGWIVFNLVVHQFRINGFIGGGLFICMGLMILGVFPESRVGAIEGFQGNLVFLKDIFIEGNLPRALYGLYQMGPSYIVATSLWMAGVMSGVAALQNVQKSKKLLGFEQRTKLNNSGIYLGTSQHTGQKVIIPDKNINQLALVVGTTGSGKTTTLRRFCERALSTNYPLVVIDGKPTEKNIEWVRKQAHQNNRVFYGFNCGNYYHYDPLAEGGFTELKDKIMTLKDHWENDYYKAVAEDYLQTTFEILQALKEPFDLKRVARCLDYAELIMSVRQSRNLHLQERVKKLSKYKRDDIRGLEAHLNLFIHSEFGTYFERNEGKMFNLREVMDQNAIVYFALPALRFPSFAKALGKLIINDMKTVIDRRSSALPIFTIFDEFSVFAGEQVLNLLNMGREKGIYAVLGTQGIADLKKVGSMFAHQVLNCVNTIICHRLNDQESVEAISNWAGVCEVFGLRELESQDVVRLKEFSIPPDAIKKELSPGDAFYITKIGGFKTDRVKIAEF